jgi:Fibronectin type III domain
VSIGYQIEKRRPGGGWEKATVVPVVGESATIPDLIEGEEYEFRVAAVTNAGVGDFSLNTMPVKVCERKRKLTDTASVSNRYCFCIQAMYAAGTFLLTHRAPTIG